MPIFKVEGNSLVPVKETPFAREGRIQDLAEQNLERVFGLQLVRHKFRVGGREIDTLAYDPETKSFVIIEYKKQENFGMMDQGGTYLNILFQNRAEFILEYNSHSKGPLSKDDVDWDQSRVLFVSPRFSEFQKASISKRFPLELWEVHGYDNGTITFNQIPDRDSVPRPGRESELVRRVIREVKVYAEEDHLKPGNPEARRLYDSLKDRVSEFGDDTRIKPLKTYISFKRQSNFADVEVQKSKLKIHINAVWGQLEDTRGVARNMKERGHLGMGDYEVTVSTPADIQAILPLLKQSYEKN